MAQFWNPQGQPQAGSAPTPSPSQPAATQSAEEAAYWAAPASTRAYMLRPGSAEWNRRQADQQVNDAQFAAAGITDPFGYALRGAGSAAPRNAQPSAPTLGTNQPSPVQLPPQGMGQPPAGMGMTNFSPAQLPRMSSPFQAPQGRVFDNFRPVQLPSQGMGQPPAGMGMTNFSPVQRPGSLAPGSLLGPLTPKPYQPTAAQQPTLGNNQASPVQLPQFQGNASGGGNGFKYQYNPAFMAYRRQRGGG